MGDILQAQTAAAAPIQAPYSGVICRATLTKLLREGSS